MRIVAGKYKGQSIATPAGRGTRPTSDRTREAIFNVLAHADWAVPLEGARIIDLFAGSGGLGLEALSRGAAFCLFVETASTARAAIRQNIEALSLFGTTRLHRRAAERLGAKPEGVGAAFDIAFLDAPYRKGLSQTALAALLDGGWIKQEGLAVVETAKDETLTADGWTLLDDRVYGAARTRFLTPSGDA